MTEAADNKSESPTAGNGDVAVSAEMPPATIKRANKPKRNVGIGHNSRAGGLDAQDDVSRETTTAPCVSDVQTAVKQFDQNKGDAERNIEQTARDTVAMLFYFIHDLIVNGNLEKFLSEHGIWVHHKVRNKIQPVVAWFFLHLRRRYVRQTVSRWSSAIGWGLHEKKTPTEFRELLDQSGVDNLADNYRSLTEPAADSAGDGKLLQELLAKGESATVYPACELTRGLAGAREFVVMIAGDGSFWLVGVSDAEPAQVVKKLLRGAYRLLGMKE